MVVRIFYDAEFEERGPELPIKPISFGFVADTGAELYVINEESLSAVLRNPWLSVNVRPNLPIKDGASIYGSAGFVSTTEWDASHPDYQHVLSLDALRTTVHAYLTGFGEPIELWADFGAYDHVVLCQLWGSMVDLPPGIPMFTHELQQEIEAYAGLDIELPPQPSPAHHALLDARWNRDVYQVLGGNWSEPLKRPAIPVQPADLPE